MTRNGPNDLELPAIGARLRGRRQALGLTFEEVARRTGLSVQQVQAIEIGNSELFRFAMPMLHIYVRSYARKVGLTLPAHGAMQKCKTAHGNFQADDYQ